MTVASHFSSDTVVCTEPRWLDYEGMPDSLVVPRRDSMPQNNPGDLQLEEQVDMKEDM